MSRYVIRPAQLEEGWWDQPVSPLPHPTTFVSEPVRTGILDPDGNDIFKVPDPVGFLAR